MLVEQVLEMVCKVLHLFLVLSAQLAVVLGVATAELAVMVVLVAVPQMALLEEQQYLERVMLVVLAQVQEVVQPQQVVAVAALEQQAAMGRLVFLVLVAQALHHLLQVPLLQGLVAAVVALEQAVLVVVAQAGQAEAVLAVKQAAQVVRQEQPTQALVAAVVQRHLLLAVQVVPELLSSS